MKKIISISIILVSGLVVLSNCKTTENSAPVALSGQVMFNGINMTSSFSNTSSNYNQKDKMTFKGQFTDPDGDHTISKAMVSYNVNMGMMNHSGEITIWDDGTHGDVTPGDGWYHMEDEMEQMMLLMGIQWSQMMGDYSFEFYCIDEDGNESNHFKVHLDIN